MAGVTNPQVKRVVGISRMSKTSSIEENIQSAAIDVRVFVIKVDFKRRGGQFDRSFEQRKIYAFYWNPLPIICESWADSAWQFSQIVKADFITEFCESTPSRSAEIGCGQTAWSAIALLKDSSKSRTRKGTSISSAWWSFAIRSLIFTIRFTIPLLFFATFRGRFALLAACRSQSLLFLASLWFQ